MVRLNYYYFFTIFSCYTHKKYYFIIFFKKRARLQYSKKMGGKLISIKRWDGINKNQCDWMRKCVERKKALMIQSLPLHLWITVVWVCTAASANGFLVFTDHVTHDGVSRMDFLLNKCILPAYPKPNAWLKRITPFYSSNKTFLNAFPCIKKMVQEMSFACLSLILHKLQKILLHLNFFSNWIQNHL